MRESVPATRREIASGEARCRSQPSSARQAVRRRRQFLTRAAILARGRADAAARFLAAVRRSPDASSAAPDADDRRRRTTRSTGTSPTTTSRSPTAWRPEQGATLQLYNYADYLSPRRRQAFEEKYNDQGPDLDVQRHRRGAHQDPRRQRRLRHLLPELRPDQQAGHRQAGPAAQPQLHPEHQQRLADVHQPLVRPGLALHRAVHHLHHRHRLADRPGARRHRRAANPYDVALGPEVQGQDRDHRRLAHRDGDGAAASRASPTSTPPTADDLKMVGDQLNALVAATSPKVTITMYNDLPAGQIGLCQMWSGDIINAQYYLPEGQSARTSCATGSPRTARAWSTTT